MSPLQVVNAVKNKNYRMSKPKGLCNGFYYNIMLKCWNEEQERRPTFDSLYNIFNSFMMMNELLLLEEIQHF